mmetsp:Transcript_120503/g.236853  ORF Transcript_120503/g.236853 Transcript_120503/m.236853 type:complete len:243 (+) Transcript_120503:158-886(+)
MPPKPLSPGLLETFMVRCELKKDEVLEQKKAFDLLDLHGTGNMSMRELTEFNAKFHIGFSKKQLAEQFREMDRDGRGGITFADYLRVYVKGTYGREVHLGLEHPETAVHDLQHTPRSRPPSAPPGGHALKPIREAGVLPELGEFDGVDMKLSCKGTIGGYVRAARRLLNGEGAAEAEGSPRSSPPQRMRLSALGEAINAALTVAVRLEAEGAARVARVRTSYPDMPNGRGCAQVVVELDKLP